MMRSLIFGLALIIALPLVITEPAAATTRCLNHELAAYRQFVRDLPDAEMVARNVGDHPMAPPDNPDVGDSWLWYTWSLNGFPEAELKMCTVRGEGVNVYIVVEDSQWLTNVDQADIDTMLEAWDNSSLGNFPDQGIHELNTTHFGPVPDELDNDPKIYVLYYDFDVNADGFFWAFDQYPDGSQMFASNECETLYMNSSDYDPGGDYLIAVQAHEFEHMIHWLADEDEVAWVDEGMAELAMWLYGRPDTISGFPSQPDNDLTVWNGIWNDYIKVYLWTLYYYEQMGGETVPIRTLMDEPANSTTGYNNALAALGSPRDFNAMFLDWIIANFFDDPMVDEGQYGYVGTDLPAFAHVTKNTYPVPPTNGSVLRYATDYVEFVDGTPLRLAFDGSLVGLWNPRVVFVSGGTIREVADIDLGGGDSGTVDLSDFGETDETVLLAITKFAPSSATSYSYWTESIPASVADLSEGVALALHPASPNPVRDLGTIRLDLARAQELRVELIDASGRLVRTLVSGVHSAGVHEIDWDGRDGQGRSVAAGVYYVRARTESETAVSRWIRID